MSAHVPAPPETALSTSKLRLLLAAEELFGTEGIAGVSLREISRHAGNRNVSAAQYHFETKTGLMAAIMEYRRPQIDRYRENLFKRRKLSFDTISAEQIIDIINRGLFFQKDADGQRTFARFLRALLLEDIFSELWATAAVTAPFTARLYEQLRRSVPAMPDRIWEFRRRQLGLFGTIAIADHARARRSSGLSDEAFLAELARMISAGLKAPQ
ncbi:MAG: TetR family transcriptional regulator [Novosphingobium sp.]|nr:TetR family transcriptional regulator [Novosphingobium sp.]